MIVAYLGNKIISGELTYSYVTSKRPDLKVEIDEYLIQKGHENLI